MYQLSKTFLPTKNWLYHRSVNRMGKFNAHRSSTLGMQKGGEYGIAVLQGRYLTIGVISIEFPIHMGEKWNWKLGEAPLRSKSKGHSF